MRFLLAFCVSVLCVTAAQPKPEDKDKEPVDEEDYSLVTCGSTIKLMHVATGYRLHSHEIPYGGQGSGQQVCLLVVSGLTSPYFLTTECHMLPERGGSQLTVGCQGRSRIPVQTR